MTETRLDDPATRYGGGVGIGGMQERIALLGGIFDIDADEKGTRVRVTLPRGGEP